ncbi:hypothetical protein AT239_04075 [Bartonella henselae]|nr:hypothetical protein AT239_04075 [Bartonella henselae]OLL53435.1 hypothetical protein AT240_03105 [Bartonella henselae]
MNKNTTDLFFQEMLQRQEFILENKKTLFKDYDLDKLLHNIPMVLEHTGLKNVQKQFHRFFDKKTLLFILVFLRVLIWMKTCRL